MRYVIDSSAGFKWAGNLLVREEPIVAARAAGPGCSTLMARQGCLRGCRLRNRNGRGRGAGLRFRDMFREVAFDALDRAVGAVTLPAEKRAAHFVATLSAITVVGHLDRPCRRVFVSCCAPNDWQTLCRELGNKAPGLLDARP